VTVALALPVGELSREAAREAARTELSRPEYADAQPPLLVRLAGRAVTFVLDLLDRAAAGAPGGRLGVVLLVLLLAAAVAVVLSRVGPLARRTAPPPVFAAGRERSADEHRAAAQDAALQERWADAVRERLRAVVRDLEARGVLDPRPGRTAGEVARDGGAALPAVAAELRQAAATFDEVWYGGRPADASSYAALVAVDEHVSRTALEVR
jgi:hypothetical protein